MGENNIYDSVEFPEIDPETKKIIAYRSDFDWIDVTNRILLDKDFASDFTNYFADLYAELKSIEDREVFLNLMEKFFETSKNFDERKDQLNKLYPMCTYLIHTEGTNQYKIGRSRNVQARAKAINSSNPRSHLVCWCEENIENYLHTVYRLKRIRGEWFEFELKELQSIVSEMKLSSKFQFSHYGNKNYGTF